MTNGCSDDSGCFKVTVRSNASKLTYMGIISYGECGDLVRKSEIFICEHTG